MQVRANGIALEVRDEGPRDGKPLLLVMGLGMQLIGWPEEFVAQLVERGFRVVRLDNRDAGLSQGFDEYGVPNLAAATLRHALRLQVRSAYSIADMARDALGVLDALRIDRAHVCGASMGGMIAQRMGVLAPERIASLTLMMTTAGARRLPQADLEVRGALLSRPASSAEADVLVHMTRLIGLIGSPAYPPDPQVLEQRLRESLRRAYRPQGTLRQLAAIIADGDRTRLLGRLKMPVHVIHGEADRLVPVAAGRHLVAQLPQASGDFIAGMGHDLPRALWPRFADGIAAVASRG